VVSKAIIDEFRDLRAIDAQKGCEDSVYKHDIYGHGFVGEFTEEVVDLTGIAQQTGNAEAFCPYEDVIIESAFSNFLVEDLNHIPVFGSYSRLN